MAANGTGYSTASYLSSIDDSEQPFTVWVPSTCSPRKKYPLGVALHGMDADPRMIPEECFRIHERGFCEDAIFLSPLGRVNVNYRQDELAGWGHNSWEWRYHPTRKKRTLVDWFLHFRKAKAPLPVLKPKRQGVIKDVIGERLIISCPAQTPIPREANSRRIEAERLTQFSFGDCVMRRGKLIVKMDAELTHADLFAANHLMLGRTDNHHCLKRIAHKLFARHVKGQMRGCGETYLGESLIAVTRQASP